MSLDINNYLEVPSYHHEDKFGERLATFIEHPSWAHKPKELWPPICAKYGWACVGEDDLRCVECRSFLNCHLPKEYGYKECLQKILEDLKDSHKSGCIWKMMQSNDRLLYIFLIYKEEALSVFNKRFESLKPSKLPQLDWPDMESIPFSKFPDHELSKTAIALALTGWCGDGLYQLFCQRCQRSFYFDLTFCGSQSIASEDIDEEGDKKERDSKVSEPFKMDTINPIHEHRTWCSWVINRPDETDPGWKVFLRSVLNNFESDNPSSKEELHDRYNKALMSLFTIKHS